MLGSVIAGCGAEAAPAPYTTRDSAGIRLVEYRSLDAAPRLRLADSVPLVRIGAAAGEPGQMLVGVTAGAVRSDGRIVLVDQRAATVLLYDSAGPLAGSQGRRGDGPDEYRAPNRLFLTTGDSLLIWDLGRSRLSVLGPDLRPARALTPEGLAVGELLGVFDGGDLMISSPSIEPAAEAGRQAEKALDLRFSPTGAREAEIGDYVVRTVQLSGLEGAGPPRPDQRITIRLVVFGPRTAQAARADGYWVGTGLARELALHDTAGAVRTLVRWQGPPLDVSDADRRAFLDEQLEQASTEEARTRLRGEGLDAFEFAPAFPPYGPLTTAADGSLWVGDFRRPGATADRFTIFDREGVLRGRVELPIGVLLWASDDRVLLRREDDLGVQRVELWRLAPAP